MESTIASRIKTKPRFLAIRSTTQLKDRIQPMSSIELWEAMAQRGLAGWKHKIMSDELQRRKLTLLSKFELNSFLKE